MLLFVGLGNPGREYAWNRHNVGFRVVDTIAERHKVGPWRKHFHGIVAKGELDEEQVLLLKPETFMNDSGLAVRAASHYFRIAPNDIVVFHDEVDLPPGKVRVKIGGTDAGHNGLRSITEHISNNYRRVRIGIGHPGIKDLVYPYVLGDFAKSERLRVETLCDIIAENAELLVRGEDAQFQNKVHLAMDAKGFVEPKRRGHPEPANWTEETAMRAFASEIYDAVRSKRLSQPFNAAMVKQACPGWADKTYNVFLSKHAVGNGTTTELFVRVAPGLYRLKNLD